MGGAIVSLLRRAKIDRLQPLDLRKNAPPRVRAPTASLIIIGVGVGECAGDAGKGKRRRCRSHDAAVGVLE
jgi:hypothetical protein